jgi:AcrR family transcriptional regulator
MNKTDCASRQRILKAALKQFAHSGYAGTSVAGIVSAAKVAKPALYYYFRNKADLYQALVDSALDERFRLMQEAAARGKILREKLVEILAALFEFQTENRELVRLAFATAFASAGEIPESTVYLAKRDRNFDFVHTLIKKELAAGRLNRKFDSKELAFGIHGLMNVYMMAHLLLPNHKLDRKTAERSVELFLSGAAVQKKQC